MIVYHKVKRAWCSGWTAGPPSMACVLPGLAKRDRDIKQVATTNDAECHGRGAVSE